MKKLSKKLKISKFTADTIRCITIIVISVSVLFLSLNFFVGEQRIYYFINVSTVFSSPKSQAAKRLVFPEGESEILSAADGETLVRVVFNGAEAASSPLIATLAMEHNIAVNIHHASTRSIEGKAYGNMLLGIPGGEESLRRALEFFKSIPNIIVEEITEEK